MLLLYKEVSFSMAIDGYKYNWSVKEVGAAIFNAASSQHPTIDDSVHIVTETDLRGIYGPGEPNDFVAIGHLASAASIPALIDINKLVTAALGDCRNYGFREINDRRRTADSHF